LQRTITSLGSLFSDPERQSLLDVAASIGSGVLDWIGGQDQVDEALPSLVDPTLGTGVTGSALLLACLEREGVAASDQEGPFRLLAMAHERWSSPSTAQHAPPGDAGLFTGAVGYALALDLVERACTDRCNCSPIQESGLDGFLAELVSDPADRHCHDLLSGLAGWGIYSLRRVDTPQARANVICIITLLDKWAERTDVGISWALPPQHSGSWGVPNHDRALGVAHGSGGVIAFLARACLAGIEHPRLRALLQQSVGWVRGPEGTGPLHEPVLSWCWGDLGIASAVRTAGIACSESEWEEWATQLALHSAGTALHVDELRDACFCHGSAGVGYMLARWYGMTGLSPFADAARRWILNTRDNVIRARREKAFVFLPRSRRPLGPTLWTSSLGLLDGVAGVGLSLLEVATNRRPRRDRAVLLNELTLC
jgi:lantibiotic modifying enzyme